MNQLSAIHTDQRTTTGIAGLDEILNGGLPSSRTFLLVGDPGCGKTILSMQWLLPNTDEDGRGLYITLAEPVSEIDRNVAAFGWDIETIDIVDFSPTENPSREDDYHVFHPHEVEQSGMWRRILDIIEKKSPTKLVIDSVTQLGYLSTDAYQFRKRMLALVSLLNRRGCTTILIYDPDQYEREMSVAQAVDGIIRLSRKLSPGLGIAMRSIEIEKLRGSDFMSGPHPLLISDQGIEIFPHRIESPGGQALGSGQNSSGIPALDELLCGGIEQGTTALFTGPAGVGKSTLGLQFLAQGGQEGQKGILYTFEESIDLIMTRCRKVGVAIEPLIEAGTLKIEHINPLQFYPDQFLHKVRHAVETEGRELVVIDSLRAYELAMEEFGMAKAHIHNLVTYLKRSGVTTILISEVENIISSELRATDIGVSHLADSVILLRYAELNGQLGKIISCLKKRSGDFQPEARQLHICSEGVTVGNKLERIDGLLAVIRDTNPL